MTKKGKSYIIKIIVTPILTQTNLRQSNDCVEEFSFENKVPLAE